MRAIAIRDFGPAEHVGPGELPDPVAGPGEVVVDIHASEVNFPDLLLVEGNYQKKPALPFAPGMGGAGVIAQVGAGVEEWRPGQRVLVLPDSGTHAENVVVPAGVCFALPDDVPFTEAAALGLAYQTAHFALVEQGRFRAEEVVLVLGATGGVGMAAVQLAKALGAGCVIAATRGGAAAGKGAEAARSAGADCVVDAAAPDLRDAVMAATGGRGADVVIDPVGGAIGEAALRAMAWRGRLVVVGFTSGQIPSFKGNYLLVKGLSVCGFQWTDYRARCSDQVRQVQAEIFRLWSEGRLRPLVARRPLDDFAGVLADLRAGRVNGKVVLTIRD